MNMNFLILYGDLILIILGLAAYYRGYMRGKESGRDEAYTEIEIHELHRKFRKLESKIDD